MPAYREETVLYGLLNYFKWAKHKDISDLELLCQAVVDRSPVAIQDYINLLIKKDETLDDVSFILSGILDDFKIDLAFRHLWKYYSPSMKSKFIDSYLGALNIKWEDSYHDSITVSQIDSKLWLIDKIVELDKDLDFRNAIVCAGWLGITNYLMFENIQLHQSINVDIDEEALEFSRHLNQQNNVYRTMNKSIIDLTEDDFKSFDLVINTSTEHMNDDWYPKIKKGTVVIVQSNDLNIPEHMNCKNSAQELADSYEHTWMIYQGELQCQGFKRFMVAFMK